MAAEYRASVLRRVFAAGSLRSDAGIERLDDPIDVVDAAGPRAAARALQRRPETACRRAAARAARGPDAAAGCAAARRTRPASSGTPSLAHEVDGAGQRVPIDHDLDEVVVAHASDRPAVQRLGADVPDAGAGRQPGEPAVGDRAPRACPRAGNVSAVVICAVSCMPVPDGPVPISTITSPSRIGRSVVPFTARIASRSSVNTRAGPRCRYTPSASTTDGSIAVALMTEPCGARLPTRKHDRAREPGARAPRRAP